MRQAAGPHHLGAGVVVLRVLHQDLGVGHHRAQQALGDGIGDLHVAAVGEVALHGVHHDVGASAGGLVVRQRHGELRVHDGEFGPGEVAAVTALDLALLFGDHGGVAHLAARGGEGQYHAQGQAGRGLALVVVEVPDVALVGHAVANGLGGVDRAAAAHGQQEVNALLLAQRDALVHQAQPRVRHRAAQRDIGDAGFIQRVRDLLQKPRAHHAAAAVVDQHLAAAEFPDQLRNPGLRVPAKDHLGGGVVLEIKHDGVLLPVDCPVSIIMNADGKINGKCMIRHSKTRCGDAPASGLTV